MGWGDIGKALIGTAPLLANLVPGGGAVVNLVASALGTDATPDAIEAKLASDPEALAKIRKLENDHQEELARLAIQQETAILQDRADARDRDIQMRKAGQRNWRADILAGLAAGALILLIVMLFRNAVPESAENAVMYILGIVSAIVTSVYNFEFGSSSGSKNKDAVIANGGRK